MATPATELPPGGDPEPAAGPGGRGQSAETLPPEAAGTPGVGVVGRSPWRIFWDRFRSDRAALAGGIFVLLLVLVAALAPLLARTLVHHRPNDLYDDMTTIFGPRGPTPRFWFGADSVGRDLFVRTLYGARTSLIVAFLATGLSVATGVTLGMLAGYLRGWVDTVVSRTIDVVMSLPILLLAIGISAACADGCLGGLVQPGLALVVGIIAFFNWTYVARIVRGQALALREREFVEAAVATGASTGRILFREILPNLAAPVIVYATLAVPGNILFEASLSFLGVGVPQTTPSWGRMLADAAQGEAYLTGWWLMVFPGLFLLLTTLSFNLVGDGLRDALDPRTGR